MKPQVGDLRTVTQRFDGEQWVLCLQSMAPRELSEDEKEKAKTQILANPEVEQSHLTSNESISQPVGWFKQDSYGVWQECWDCSLDPKGIPLYTAPRELSEDEILSLQWVVHYADASELVDFARAILKKASEK